MSWQPPPQGLPSSRSSAPSSGGCRRRNVQPRVCTSEELRQQVEFTQKQIDMCKEALAKREKGARGDIQKTVEETAARNKEVEKVTAEIQELRTQKEQLTTEVAEKDARYLALCKANELLVMHLRKQVEELSQAAERERIVTRQLSPNQTTAPPTSPVRCGESVQERSNSPQPGPRWQQPPQSFPTPPSSVLPDGRRGLVRVPPVFPQTSPYGAAAAGAPVQAIRMTTPPRGLSPSGGCRAAKLQPRQCTSEELRQQIEFIQKQVEMTKEALAAQEKRTKEDIKKTEAATEAKNKEIEMVTAELGQLTSQVEELMTEVQSKEAELLTLHTANQIETEHMREEIVELSESAEQERIAREQLIPELDQVQHVLSSTPCRFADLERQQQELQSEIEYLRNDPSCPVEFMPGTDMSNFETYNAMPEFEPMPDFLNFNVPLSQACSRTPPPQSPRSPNYYTNLLLNPCCESPPLLPTDEDTWDELDDPSEWLALAQEYQ